MATHNVVRAYHGTAAAATEEIVNLSASIGAVRVRNRGTNDLYFTINGITAVAVAADMYYCGPGENVTIDHSGAAVPVHLISTSGTDYTVEGY